MHKFSATYSNKTLNVRSRRTITVFSGFKTERKRPDENKTSEIVSVRKPVTRSERTPGLVVELPKDK